MTESATQLEANYYLAKAYEAKSLLALARGNEFANENPFCTEANKEYRHALLYALEAQKRQIPDGKIAVLPESLSQISVIPDSVLESEVYKTSHLALDSTEAIAYSPDGKVIAVGEGGGYIQLWDAQSGSPITILKGHTDSKAVPGWSRTINALAYSPDGKTIATGSWRGSILLWDAKSLALTNTLEENSPWQVKSLAYSSDGKVIASTAGHAIQLWSTQSGSVIKTLKSHSSYVNILAYSPDGTIIASGSDDNTIRLWDAESFELIATLNKHSGSIEALTFSPDSNVIVSGASDRTIRLWNTQSFETTNQMMAPSDSGMFNPVKLLRPLSGIPPIH